MQLAAGDDPVLHREERCHGGGQQHGERDAMHAAPEPEPLPGGGVEEDARGRDHGQQRTQRTGQELAESRVADEERRDQGLEGVRETNRAAHGADAAHGHELQQTRSAQPPQGQRDHQRRDHE